MKSKKLNEYFSTDGRQIRISATKESRDINNNNSSSSFPHQCVISVTALTGLNAIFPGDAHKRKSRLQGFGGAIHLVGFAPQHGYNATQFYEVLHLQAVFIDRAAAELLQEMLQGVSDSEAIQAISPLYVDAMRLGEA